MKKYLAIWIVVLAVVLGLIGVASAVSTPFFSPLAKTGPTPTPTPIVNDSIDRPTSNPYKGDLARFDRENRAENLEIERVMDILKIESGSAVADIGAGGGWFSVIASKRVKGKGKVYAVDINQESVVYIDKRSKEEGLENIVTVLGVPDDPKLPADSIDAVVILNTYHEITEPVRYLKNLRKALKNGALVGILDREGDGGDHGIDQSVVKAEAARSGFEFVATYDFVKKGRMDYFLVFKKL